MDNKEVLGRLKTSFNVALTLGLLYVVASITSDKEAQRAFSNFFRPEPESGRVLPQGLPSEQEFKRVEVAPREQQIITDYTLQRLELVGSNGIFGFASLPDNTRYAIRGTLDNAGNLTLEAKGQISFLPLDVAVSPTNPNVLAIVGDQSSRANQGRLWLSLDGGQTWQLFQDGGTKFSTEFTSDGRYLIIAEADSANDNLPKWKIFDPATKTFAELTCSGAGCAAGRLTNFSPGASPDTYVSYGIDPLRTGYMKQTVNTAQRTVTTERLNTQEGYARAELVQFTDSQGRLHLWLFNNDTMGISPNDPNRPTGTIYENVNNVLTYQIQPKTSLYPEAQGNLNSVGVERGVADRASDKGYMAVGVNVNNILFPYVEEFSLSSPLDFSQRRLVPKDGLPTGGTVGDSFASLDLLVSGGKKYLVDSLKNSPRSGENGVYIGDIITGISPEKPWRKVNLNISEPVTPTPTPTPPRDNKLFFPIIIKQ